MLALLAALGAAGCGRSALSSSGGPGSTDRADGGGELLGQHRRPARGREGGGHEHHRQPRHRPALLRSDGRGRGRDGPLTDGDRQRHRLRHVGLEAARREPLRRACRTRRRLPARALPGRQPAPVVLAGERAPGGRRRSPPTTSAWTLPTRPTSSSRRRQFETTALAEYDRLRSEIRTRFAGVPVGYSESIFRPLGESLGLKLMTPYSFAKAIAEGTDVSAQDKQTVDHQAQSHAIKVWVYNSQNATPDVQRVNQLAREAAHPDHDRHRDALSGLGYLRAVAERAAEEPARAPCTRRRADERPLPCRPARGREVAAAGGPPAVSVVDGQARIGGRVIWERGEHRDRARVSSPPSSGPTDRARRRCCGSCSESWRSRVAARRCWAVRPGPASGRSATCPSAGTSSREPGSAGSTSFVSASTGHAGGCRCVAPAASGSSGCWSSSAPTPTPAGRSGRSPVASSSGC